MFPLGSSTTNNCSETEQIDSTVSTKRRMIGERQHKIMHPWVHLPRTIVPKTSNGSTSKGGMAAPYVCLSQSGAAPSGRRRLTCPFRGDPGWTAACPSPPSTSTVQKKKPVHRGEILDVWSQDNKITHFYNACMGLEGLLMGDGQTTGVCVKKKNHHERLHYKNSHRTTTTNSTRQR